MNKPSYSVEIKTDKYPSGLKTAEEISAQIDIINTERLIELTNSGYIPHFRIDNGPPLYMISEVKQWIASNLVSRHTGRGIEKTIRVVTDAPLPTDAPPNKISNIPNLQQIPSYEYRPGIYFLCNGDEVVYVGQSESPAMRVGNHVCEGVKQFDRVYLLPVPKSELNDVEAAFIKHLHPRLNGEVKGASGKKVSPVASKSYNEILQKIGYEHHG